MDNVENKEDENNLKNNEQNSNNNCIEEQTEKEDVDKLVDDLANKRFEELKLNYEVESLLKSKNIDKSILDIVKYDDINTLRTNLEVLGNAFKFKIDEKIIIPSTKGSNSDTSYHNELRKIFTNGGY